jgi:cytochrome c-type biogenesis protein CcmH
MDRNLKSLLRCGRSLFFFSVMVCSVCFSATEIYPFDSVVQKARFQKMIVELRCLVCQNQNLADSNAPLAQDLRQMISQRIKKGESEQHIKQYLASRYGEYILFKPLFSSLTYFLWFGPFILFVILVIVILGKRGWKSLKNINEKKHESNLYETSE